MPSPDDPNPARGNPDSVGVEDFVRQQVRQLAEQAQEGSVSADQAERIRDLPPELQEEDERQTIGLKKKYAHWLLYALVLQFFVGNVVFIIYASWGMSWEIPARVISIYFSATVAEIVSLVYVITRHLFPRRDLR